MNKYRILQIMTWVNTTVLAGLMVGMVGVGLFMCLSNETLRDRIQLGERLSHVGVRHLFIDERKLGLPIYDLQVSRNDWDALLSELPSKGELLLDKQYYPATFTYQGQKHKVKFRVRGLSHVHWANPKKSWRIRFRKSAPFEGMRSINLILPQDRLYVVEHLSNYVAQKLDLVVPDSRFALLRINDRLQGLYFEIEQPSRRMLARHGWPDNVNFYNEDDWNWSVYGRFPIYQSVGFWRKVAAEAFSDIDNYSSLDKLLWLVNEASDDEFQQRIGDIIDLENFYRWQSHSVVMGSRHQEYHNMYLPENPITGRIEFMPWDVYQWQYAGQFVDQEYNPLVTRVLSFPQFRQARNRVLWQYVSNEAQLEDDLRLYDETYRQIRPAFHVDRMKGILNWRVDREVKRHRNIFLSNHQKIVNNLQFCQVYATVRYPAARDAVAVGIDINVHGFSSALLQGVSLYLGPEAPATGAWELWYDSNHSGSLDQEDQHVAAFKLNLQREGLVTPPIELMLYERRGDQLRPQASRHALFVVARDTNARPEQVELDVVNAVTGEEAEPTYRTVDERALAHFDAISVEGDHWLSDAPFIRQDPTRRRRLVVPAGEHDLEETLVVPRGYELLIQPGATLRFAPGVSLISYSPVEAIGTAERLIRFTAVDSTRPWGVFGVVGDGRGVCRFAHVVVEHGGEAVINGIYFTGALAVHNMACHVHDSLFQFNTGDDGLNVKLASEATLTDSEFVENRMDGVDFDFTAGHITGNVFRRNGGDHIDLGSAAPVIRNNHLEGAGDKGISVGESSSPVIFNNLIVGCEMGIGIKDGSHPVILNTTLVRNGRAIAGYVKKPVFGGARGEVHNSLLWNNGEGIHLDGQSSLVVSHTLVQGGYEGTGNLDRAPEFIDEAGLNYLLAASTTNQPLLVHGMVSVVQEVIPEYAAPSVPVGMVSQPQVRTR